MIRDDLFPVLQTYRNSLRRKIQKQLPFNIAILLILFILCWIIYMVLRIQHLVEFISNKNKNAINFLGIITQTPALSNHTLNEPFIVHYFLFQPNPYPGQEISLTFLDCMSVLSVMKNLSPDAIFLHTNRPEFWPFLPCNNVITNWTILRIVPTQLKFAVNGKEISYIEHEADIAKMKSVLEHGGLALDFDVFMINGSRLRYLLLQHPCVLCKELVGSQWQMNAGFVACRRNATYPRLILERSYHLDFRPDNWLYNSGALPWKLYKEYGMAHVEDGICDAPSWKDRELFVERRGHYTWMDKIAHHSFFHDKDYSLEKLRNNNINSSMGDLLKWILDR